MSRQINQPINQVRLTNVAVVRYNVKGKRFEIACYRNKVMDYRAGLETDLSEVLQTDRIFTNVSKGRFAAANDLKKAFGTTDQEAIAQRILQEGKSLQVSDLERTQMLESTVTQIATWVAHNCVHPTTARPYTVSQIKQALGKNYQVQAHKAIKKQYLDAVKFLKDVIPIERAKMELSLQYPDEKNDTVQESLRDMDYILVKEDSTVEYETTLTLQVDPSLYRQLNQLAQDMNGRLEILQQQVVSEQQEDVDLEQDLQQRQQKQPAVPTATVVDSFDSDDEEAVALAAKLKAVRMQTAPEEKESDNDSDSSEEKEDSFVSIEEKNEEESSEENSQEESSDSDDGDESHLQSIASRRKNQRKAQKKKDKKAKRRLQQRQQQEEDSESSDDGRLQKVVSLTATQTTRESASSSAVAATSASSSNARSCNTCGGSFANAAEYRAHFRSDWHRFNQKLKVKGLPPVSEQEFLLCDADAFFGVTED